MSEGRDIYHEPEDRVLLRTPDAYQTVLDDDIETYSDTLLTVVADYRNGGMPEGTNAQSMVGKSKRGEVACRLFARVNPETQLIEAAGFKTRGCLAMTACASMICTMIEGKTLQQALAITKDDVRAALDGVPASKVNTLTFVTEAVRALVGDYYLRQGYSIAQLDEELPCESYSLSCIMCEHCSLRDIRIDKQLEEQRAEKELAEHNALANVFMLVREDSRNSKLSGPARWEAAGLVPQHMTTEDLEMRVYDFLLEWQKEHPQTEQATPQQVAQRATASANTPAATQAVKQSLFASRSVGISRFVRLAKPEAVLQKEPKEAAVQNGIEKTAQGVVQVQSAHTASNSSEQAFAQTAPSTNVQPKEAEASTGLRVPEGYELREIEGEWVLVQTEQQPEPKELTIDATDIVMLVGQKGYYLFDQTTMTHNFAHWAFLAAEDNPVVTLAGCVREESRIYPRPMPASSLENDPFMMNEQEIEAAWEQLSECSEYADIKRIVASNGDVYFYSETYLSQSRATSLAEWDAVERYMNV